MSTPKPRIRPKADPCRQRSEPPPQAPLYEPDSDPHDPFAEYAAVVEGQPASRVIFQEDDCLR